MLPAAQGDDLGADRDRGLLGGAGAEVEADRRHEPRQRGVGDAGLPQALDPSAWVRRVPMAPR